MESSSTSSWKSTKSLKLSSGLGIGRETLITSSTRELVEFYWTNRKRFSGDYLSFTSKKSRKRISDDSDKKHSKLKLRLGKVRPR